MNITLDEVKRIFISVIRERITREDADRWAFAIIKKMEANELIYLPPGDKEKILSGIMFLYGIDIRTTPTNYLHNTEDIKEIFINRLDGTKEEIV